MGASVLAMNGRGKFEIGGEEVEDGTELEVWRNGQYVKGKVEYCPWRFAHRLRLGSCSIDLRAGMWIRI
jgi:hypothetical protein